MTRLAITIVLTLVAFVTGIALGRWWLQPEIKDGSSSAVGERAVLYWKAQMDPNYRRDEPGKSPMGMDLVPVYADNAGGDETGVVRINPAIVNNLGVRTAAVELGVLSRHVETVGYVANDEDTLSHIHTRVDGWIEELAVTSTGDPVIAGQTLFELYSPTLVNAQEEYLAALQSQNAALKRASRDRLAALGVSSVEIERIDKTRKAEQRVRVIAKNSGYATDLSVREGMFVTPATRIMSIAQLDRVWIMAEVFERQASWIETGQKAEFELDYLPGQRWQGTVDYVYPELNPKTRTLNVRLRFDNESEVLRPNMFARVTIYGTEIPSAIHIPRTALIRGGAANRVVLSLGDGRFRSQAVGIGIESGDRVEIRTGLSAGDIVVTSGQFLIDSESNLESALKRFDDTDQRRAEMESDQ